MGIKLLQVFIEPLGEKLVVDKRAREWCGLPYPGHPKGCPAYGRPWCPPDSQILTDYMDPKFIVACEFDLEEWMDRWHAKFPKHTVKQQKDSIFWQGNARKQLRSVIDKFIREREHLGEFLVSTDATKLPGSPEAMGVNVFATMANFGIHLETPRDIKPSSCKSVWCIAILGYKK